MKKVCLIGQSNLGKTKSIMQTFNGTSLRLNAGNYVPTLGVDIHPIRFGDHALNVWDIGGTYIGNQEEKYYARSHGAIIYYSNSIPIPNHRVNTFLEVNPNAQVEYVNVDEIEDYKPIFSKF